MLDQLANQIGEILVKALRRQFTLQGHKLTGKLNASIEDLVIKRTTGVKIQVLFEEYGIYVNNGVAASRIPYSPGSRTGAGKSKYISGLEMFARLRFGLSGRDALNAAFAIAAKHARQGMPTKASKRFSKTGKRTQAIEAALKDTEEQIEQLTTDLLQEVIKNLAA